MVVSGINWRERCCHYVLLKVFNITYSLFGMDISASRDHHSPIMPLVIQSLTLWFLLKKTWLPQSWNLEIKWLIRVARNGTYTAVKGFLFFSCLKAKCTAPCLGAHLLLGLTAGDSCYRRLPCSHATQEGKSNTALQKKKINKRRRTNLLKLSPETKIWRNKRARSWG